MPVPMLALWHALFTLAFSADVWQSLSPSGAPIARYRHSAVWSSEVDGMYVFLGTGASDLQFYNRGANTWQLVSPSGSAPSVNNAVWSSQMDGMLIFGGKGLDTCCDNNLYYYSRQGNSWSQLHPTGTKPIARYSHSVVWSPSADGMYVFGGLDSLGTRYDDLHFFDRQGNAWQALSPTGFGPSARSGHSAVWSAAADGMYIYSGSDAFGTNNELYFYDRSTNQWQHMGNGYGSRTEHVAVWSPSADGMYVFGGETSGGNQNDLTFFDRQTQSWQNIFPGGTLPEARSKHTAVWSPEVNGMFVFGGFGTSALNDLHFHGALGAASTPSAVVGDPITWYKGKKVKFWFPPDELLLILTTPELKLWASTFTGPSIDFQWFGRFVVTTVEGLEMVAVQVRRGAVKQNTCDFEELVVTMGGRPLRGRGSRLFAGANRTHVAVGVRSLRHLASNGNLEFVMVESPSISFMIHASPAATEFPEDAEKQLEFRHLDWIHLESPSGANFTGILPQLWGLEARTPEVEAMLLAPSQRELKAHATHPEPEVPRSC